MSQAHQKVIDLKSCTMKQKWTIIVLGRNTWARFDGLIDQISVYSFSSNGYLKHNFVVIHPVRNDGPLGFESQRLEFLTGFTSCHVFPSLFSGPRIVLNSRRMFCKIIISSLTTITTFICKIPPNLPFPKGGMTPLWQRGARGDFLMTMSIQFQDP
jgi:hypothetical protein